MIACRNVVLLVCFLHSSFLRAQVGHDWGIQGSTYVDPVTKVEIREYTGAKTTSDNLYYHFSNFTADNRHLIFTSDLGGERQIFRAEVETGRVVQLTAGGGINSRSACPDPARPNRLYYLRGPEVFSMDIADFSAKKIGEIPEPRIGGYQQPTISGDGRWMTLSKQCDETTWEIGLLDLESSEYRTILRQGFRIGHVQHSPTDPIVFYVWETGGYAPQRSWLVNTDGTGNHPFYFRVNPKSWFTPLKEWVTHESWVRDTGEMTMIIDKQGVILVNKDGSSRLVSRGHYWHACSRPDGKFLVLDDFEGQLWLVKTSTGSRRLLATGLSDTAKVHPHASFDRKGEYLQFHTGHTHETVAVINLKNLPTLDWQ